MPYSYLDRFRSSDVDPLPGMDVLVVERYTPRLLVEAITRMASPPRPSEGPCLEVWTNCHGLRSGRSRPLLARPMANCSAT